jgi:hypothetical protein
VPMLDAGCWLLAAGRWMLDNLNFTNSAIHL